MEQRQGSSAQIKNSENFFLHVRDFLARLDGEREVLSGKKMYNHKNGCTELVRISVRTVRIIEYASNKQANKQTNEIAKRDQR